MKKSFIALGTVALCGTLFADVSSANVVGYSTVVKTDASYETYTCPFIKIGGAADQKYRLYDLKMTTAKNLAAKKASYIQFMEPVTLVLDETRKYYWDYNKVPSWESATGKKGCWCFKSNDKEVPLDTTFNAGDGFLCFFMADNVSITFNGEVWKPVPDEEGNITVDKPEGSMQFFFGNPFAVPVSLADMKIITQKNLAAKKASYIQQMEKNNLLLDEARKYYWDYNKTPAKGGAKGCWCYKSTESEVLNPEEIIFKPGEGFLCIFPATAFSEQLKIKVPASINSL